MNNTLQNHAADIAKLKDYLINMIGTELESNPPPPDQRRQVITQTLQAAYQSTKLQLPATLREQLFRDILDDLLGLGPIQFLLDDESVSEIMVNGPKKVFIERKGKLVKTNITFESDNAILRLIEKIIAPLGRRIDADTPTVDARLADGSRVNAVIPPCAIDGPTITIRKFMKDKLTIEQLISLDTLTKTMAEFLRACVISRLNIIISGGTGSGKTTFLNVLSSYIPEDERIITIEDAAELKLQQDHVVRLETKPSDADGRYAVPIRELVRNSLRMRPDRIIVGECRGAEALDMLQAMNTGHDGSMTTIHANTPRDAISRLEMMVGMAGFELPVWVIRRQVASTINVVVQAARLIGGLRKIIKISEITGMEGDVISMQDIYEFKQTGLDENRVAQGHFVSNGIRPACLAKLQACGVPLPVEIFERRVLKC